MHHGWVPDLMTTRRRRAGRLFVTVLGLVLAVGFFVWMFVVVQMDPQPNPREDPATWSPG